MTDLISRSAAIADLVEWMDDDTGNEFDRGYDFAMKRAIRRLRSAPDVDAVLVVHSGWKVQDYTFTRFQCTACKSMNHSIMTKYCPNCSARMDGEADG